jgi:hypothetical protein
MKYDYEFTHFWKGPRTQTNSASPSHFPVIGERWWIKLPQQVTLTDCTVVSQSVHTVTLHLEELPYKPITYLKSDLEFVEKI